LAIPTRRRTAGGAPSPSWKRPTSPRSGGTVQPPENVEQLFEPFWEAWNIVHEDYVDQPLDDGALMRGAIRGMVDSLGDPHSSYMDPDEYLQANLPLDGEYEGIGAWVDSEGELLTIISAMPDSPAERAGLQPGDQVIAVDGEDVTALDGSLVIRRVLGRRPCGSDHPPKAQSNHCGQHAGADCAQRGRDAEGGSATCGCTFGVGRRRSGAGSAILLRRIHWLILDAATAAVSHHRWGGSQFIPQTRC
jgi:hypothetical protein